MNKNEILKILTKDARSFYNLTLADIVESTNDTVKAQAKNSAPEGTVLISEEQTKVRVQRDEAFSHPKVTESI